MRTAKKKLHEGQQTMVNNYTDLEHALMVIEKMEWFLLQDAKCSAVDDITWYAEHMRTQMAKLKALHGVKANVLGLK